MMLMIKRTVTPPSMNPLGSMMLGSVEMNITHTKHTILDCVCVKKVSQAFVFLRHFLGITALLWQSHLTPQTHNGHENNVLTWFLKTFKFIF